MCLDPSAWVEIAIDECNSEHGTPFFITNDASPAPCDGVLAETGQADDGLDSSGDDAPDVDCTGWDPSSNIWFSGGVYHMDGFFFLDLVDDPRLIPICDTSRVEPQTAGGFVVVGASSGTLLHELGLQNGDEFVSINGHSLSTYGDAADAFGIEWLEDGEDDYVLVVDRGGNNVTLYYKLAWPSR